MSSRSHIALLVRVSQIQFDIAAKFQELALADRDAARELAQRLMEAFTPESADSPSQRDATTIPCPAMIGDDPCDPRRCGAD